MTEDTTEDRFCTHHLRTDLTGRSVRSGVVTVSAQMVQFALNLVSVMIMARLLTPVEYGLVAMVAPITGFVGLFKDLGLTAATVQKDRITHDQVSTLFWINVALSIGLALVCAAISPAVGLFYRDNRTTWIMLAMAGTFVLSGLTAQHSALLRRQMRFGTLAWIDILTALVSLVVGTLAAWLGWRYWALVAMTVSASLCNCVAVWCASPWRPGKAASLASVRDMMKFGGCLTASQVSNFISGNTDKLIIGRVLGAAPLGIYNRAFQLLLMPLEQVFRPVSSVFLTSLSRIVQEPARYRQAVKQIGEILLIAVTPLAGISIVLAPEIVHVFLGPGWSQSVPVFRALAIIALSLPMNNLGSIILQSSDRTSVMMKWAPVAMIISIASILAGLPWGLSGIAISWAAGALFVRTPLFYLIISRCTHITFLDMAAPLLFYTIPLALLVLGGFAMRHTLPATTPIVTILVLGSILAGGYSVFLFLTGKHQLLMALARRGRTCVIT